MLLKKEVMLSGMSTSQITEDVVAEHTKAELVTLSSGESDDDGFK